MSDMMNTEESWKKYKPELSKSSIKKRIGDVNRLNAFDTLEDKKKYILSLKSPLTRQGIASSLIEYERLQGHDVYELNIWNKQFTIEYKNFYSEPKVLKTSVEEIEEKIKKLMDNYNKSKYWMDRQDLLLIYLFKHHPMRNALRILKKSNYNEDIDNYIDQEYCIVLNKFKNEGKKKQHRWQVTDDKIKELIDAIDTDYVLIPRRSNKEDKPYSVRGYQKMTKEICGCTGLDMRHLYVSSTKVSQQVTEDWIDTYNELKEESKKCDHSLEVHLKYRGKEKNKKKEKQEQEKEKKVNEIRKQLFFKKKIKIL